MIGSFGLGFYGLLCLAAIVLLLLRDPVWRTQAEKDPPEDTSQLD
jgi:hypothetical protein